jgi:hypothetical protein
VYADELLWPWTERLLRDLPDVSPFDVHTHVGTNDPSGFGATVTELVAALATVRSRAAVFPLAEPEGYSEANDRVLAAAAATSRTRHPSGRCTRPCGAAGTPGSKRWSLRR